MHAELWLPFVIRVTVAVVIVVAIVEAGARLGATIGGLLVSIPLSAALSYSLLATQHDAAFLERAAFGSLVGNPAGILFFITFIRLAPHTGSILCIAASIAVWGTAIFAFHLFEWNLLAAILANVAVYVVAFYLTPSIELPARVKTTPPKWYDLPLRSTITALFVSGVVSQSSLMGPVATGLATVFPINSTCVALIIHARLGGHFAATMMSSALRAMVGFPVAVLAFILLAPHTGLAIGFASAMFISIAWAAILMLLHHAKYPVSGTLERKHSPL